MGLGRKITRGVKKAVSGVTKAVSNVARKPITSTIKSAKEAVSSPQNFAKAAAKGHALGVLRKATLGFKKGGSTDKVGRAVKTKSADVKGRSMRGK